MSRASVAVYAIPECYPDGAIAYAHDHAMAIMQNGKVLKYLHLERKSRIKRDNTLPDHIYELIKASGLLKTDFDLISVDSVQGRSFISSCGRIRIEAQRNKTLPLQHEEAWCWFLNEPRNAFVISHELAHVYSNLPFNGEFKENSLLVHFDGGASLSNFSAWHFKNNTLRSVEYHWELKHLSSLFNANALTFSIIGANFSNQHSVPGKFMGFAGFGSYKKEIEDFLKKHRFFQDNWGKPSTFFYEVRKHFGIDLNHYDQHHPFLQDVAASMHEYWVSELMCVLERLKEQTGAEHLYYSGGAALNIVANTRIVNSGLFGGVYIPPCADDSGLVLGAAAFLEQQKGQVIKNHSPYLNNWGIEDYSCNVHKEDLKTVAKKLSGGAVIGICNGKAECGPRALGNRSLIARADSTTLAQKVSCQIKGREWYRPVAPIILAKHVHYFTGFEPHALSKHMLIDFPILPEKIKELEGATHVDGTARIQALFSRDDNPWMFDLLELLDKDYGIKALINTSFNKRGEPIVHTAEDAQKAYSNLKLDGLVLNGKFI